MSWHFSRALAGAYLPGTCSDGAASAQLKSTSTPGECCSPARTTGASPHSPCGMTSEHSTRCRGEGWSTSCRADFRAPTSRSLAAEQASTASTPDFGRTWPGSFATFDLGSCSWRTRQPSLLGDSDEFLETWPRSGSMRSGACWEQPMLAPTTGVTGYGSLPTPAACRSGSNQSPSPGASVRPSLDTMAAPGMLPTPTARLGDGRGMPSPELAQSRFDSGRRNLDDAVMLPTPTVDGNYNRRGASAQSGDGLHTALTRLATPTARDWRSGKASAETMERNARPLSEQIGGLLNPEFVEWMMGWPRGWTRTDGATGAAAESRQRSKRCPTAPRACDASETGRSRSARPKRGGNSSPARQ